MKNKKIDHLFKKSILVKKLCVKKGLKVLYEMGNNACKLIQNNGKIMLCGNGGSAADAQHLAAEMLIRLKPKNNREGLPAISLAQDTSTITACSNDYGYDFLYERIINSLGNQNDCLLIISTSGNSKNIINAAAAAKKKNIKVFGFLGSGGGEALKFCDKAFIVPSFETGRIQEAHITAGHALMEYIEDKLLKIGYLNLKNDI